MMDFLSGFGTLSIVIVLIAVFLAIKCVKQVPQGSEWTVERLGRYFKTLRPGLNFLIPLVDSVGYKLNMKEQVLDVPSQEVISKDNASVKVNGVVFFQIVSASKAAYEINDLDWAITNLVITNLRTVLGSMELDGMLSQRDSINARLLTVVDNATNPWGIKVTRIEIKDIQPPKDTLDAMARQMKAEREKRAVILESEGLRQSEILKAEGQKKAIVLKAEGEKEAKFREAEARERLAKAEAYSTSVVSEAIANGNMGAINYFVAQKYIEALGSIASADNQKLIMMPLEAASVVGSLGGITEIVKDTFSGASLPKKTASKKA